MSSLKIINETNQFKINDTGSNIEFKAFDDNNNPVGLQQGQTATFSIMNGLGKLLDVQAVTTQGGYVFNLPTNKLSTLSTGRYQVELKVNGAIYPDKDFVSFTINNNALMIYNNEIPAINLNDFKADLKNYADNEITTQINQAKTNLESDFSKYADKLNSGTLISIKANTTMIGALGKQISQLNIQPDFASVACQIHGNYCWNSDFIDPNGIVENWGAASGWYFSDGSPLGASSWWMSRNATKLNGIKSTTYGASRPIRMGNGIKPYTASVELFAMKNKAGGPTYSYSVQFSNNPKFDNPKNLYTVPIGSTSDTNWKELKKEGISVGWQYPWVRLMFTVDSDPSNSYYYDWLSDPMITKTSTVPNSYISSSYFG